MTPAPAASATISGGSRAATAAGTALASRNAAVMAAAIQRSLWKARTQSSPNCRNTPATMPMTIGIGTACMARRTQPVDAQRQHQQAGGDEGADHLREREVAERGADQHGAGDGPEEHQRLAPGEAEGDADQRR